MEGLKFFDCECIDKQTSRMFLLRLPGSAEEEARSIASACGFITGPLLPLNLKESRASAQLIASIGRHFMLQNLAEACYKERDARRDALVRCESACWQWFMELPWLMEAIQRTWIDENGRLKVVVLVPKRLGILLEKQGDIERAREVCEVAASLPLKQEDVDDLAWRAAKLKKRRS